MSPLHWTVDHGRKPRDWDFTEGFSAPLAAALSAEPIAADADRKTHRYLMVPNKYVDLYQRDRIEMGSVSIERRLASGGDWSYRVSQEDEQSGESLTLEFSCGADQTRPLRSPWTLRTNNSADGAYQTVVWTGSCEAAEAGVDVRLTTARGLSFPAGSCGSATPTCFWALLDIVPALNGAGLDDLCILEDLEVPKPNCRVLPLESWTFEAGGDRHELTGYSLHGEGLPPSYWWITNTGDVAAIGTIFMSYVLAERRG